MVRDSQWTRRQALARAGTAAGGLGLAGLAGHLWPRAAAGGGVRATVRASGAVPGIQRFISRPDLSPPAVTLTHPSPLFPPGAEASSYLFTAPQGSPGQAGLMILDRQGRLVWFSPAAGGLRKMALNVQAYRGRPVLTWWEGTMVHGVGQGTSYIADGSYNPVRSVQAGHGLKADLHELVITPQDTALITAYRHRAADLSALGGPAGGVILSSVAQEIDIATGRLLFEWDSLDHVDVTQSCLKLTGGTAKRPFDYFHINSIALAPDGDLLISARNTWAVYKVARSDGSIRWQLGGKKSSFAMGPGTRFYWQHHARAAGHAGLSLFDDGAAPAKEKQSRALLLEIDTSAMRATLRQAYVHPAGLLANAMGSIQVLADGRVFVGWGTEPYFSEFTADGHLILDGQFPGGDDSYRSFTYPWTGRPAAPPAIAVRPSPDGGALVYASWNGATDVQGWAVLAGKAPSSLARVAAQERTGFETEIAVAGTGPHFAVVAVGAGGRVLGRSATARLAAT